MRKNKYLRVLNWNIANPSLVRAKKQAEWISKINARIVILTEAKDSEGCRFLRSFLADNNFKVYFNEFQDESHYGVIVAEKGLNSTSEQLNVSVLPERIVNIKLNNSSSEINICGLYVPSRGPKHRKNIDKMNFQNQVSDLLMKGLLGKKKDLIIGGDLNVIDPEHSPKYKVFGDWEYAFYESFIKAKMIDIYKENNLKQEYSWFGRTGNGYRFDYFFVSEAVREKVKSCRYVHTPRKLGLSDHSAMELILAI